MWLAVLYHIENNTSVNIISCIKIHLWPSTISVLMSMKYELYLLTLLEWYLPVYTPVNDMLSSLWVVFTHSSWVVFTSIHPCEWYFIICVSCIYSLLLSGIYQYTPPVSDILSSLWVVFTHSCWVVFTSIHPCEWFFIFLVSCIYSLLCVVVTSIHPLIQLTRMIKYHLQGVYTGKYHSRGVSKYNSHRW
jgi:hypothetical protein